MRGRSLLLASSSPRIHHRIYWKNGIPNISSSLPQRSVALRSHYAMNYSQSIWTQHCHSSAMKLSSSTNSLFFTSSNGSHSRGSNFRQLFGKMGLFAVGCLSSLLIGSKQRLKASEAESVGARRRQLEEEEESQVIREADVLYSQNQIDSLYEFLKLYEDVESSQICWRLARVACNKAKNCDPKSEERKFFMHEGFGYAERSISYDDKCGACHRWYGVMLNYVGDYEGTKQKLKYSYIVKDHFEKAIELNPKDATAMYCLGQWCYFFADMSWYTQKIAALIFGTTPTSTFQEALALFIQAEQADPNFYSMNHVMLARTYLKLSDKANAKVHLVKAREMPVKSADDIQAHAESIELLSQM